MSESDYWRHVRAERESEIRALGPRPGCYVQLSDWYGDVWGEVLDVWDNALVLCASEERAPEYKFFHQLRPKLSAGPPRDARIIYALNGLGPARRVVKYVTKPGLTASHQCLLAAVSWVMVA